MRFFSIFLWSRQEFFGRLANELNSAEEIGLTYTGKLVEKKWSKSKEDYKLKFMDDDGTFTYFFEGAIDRQYNIVKVL